MIRTSIVPGGLARIVRLAAALGMGVALVVLVTPGRAVAEGPDGRPLAPAQAQAQAGAPLQVAPPGGLDLDAVTAQARTIALAVQSWYLRTPPADRVTWGGLAAAAGLGLGVLLERWVRLRPRRIIPEEFPSRFTERLQDGRLDRGKALDYCELHVSPASRVALAAVKRWGRPTADLERAAQLAQRVEAERLRRNVGTLRRIAALTPLIGLLGTLTALSRALAGLGTTPEVTAAVWGPAVAAALWPLTAGVALATLALVAYDGLSGRVEYLADTLDRIGAETIDAIALAFPLPTAASPEARGVSLGTAHSHGPHTPAGPTRPPQPHQVRLEVPTRPTSRLDDDDDLD